MQCSARVSKSHLNAPHSLLNLLQFAALTSVKEPASLRYQQKLWPEGRVAVRGGGQISCALVKNKFPLAAAHGAWPGPQTELKIATKKSI